MTVKTRPFLRDVDDVQLYADMLENVHLLFYEELGDILAKFPIMETQGRWLTETFSQGLRVTQRYDELARMRHTMSLLMRDMVERKQRLSGDGTIGLADVELDEEGS